MSSRRKTILAFLLVPMALLLTLTSVSVASARSGHDGGSSATHSILGKRPKIKISAFTFTVPRRVKPGAKVVVINNDAIKHTVTSDDGTSFDVSVPGNSKVTFVAPATPGSYAFHCAIHPTMQAVLKVKQPA